MELGDLVGKFPPTTKIDIGLTGGNGKHVNKHDITLKDIAEKAPELLDIDVHTCQAFAEDHLRVLVIPWRQSIMDELIAKLNN